jgi:hypothetical protein
LNYERIKSEIYGAVGAKLNQPRPIGAMSVSEHALTDRYGATYRVESERALLWSFCIWAGGQKVGHVDCDDRTSVLKINDLVLRAKVPFAEARFARWVRKFRGLPSPTQSYRDRGIGTAMLRLIEALARAEGFVAIQGWISKVDTDRDPDLPNWYRRRGFVVVEGPGEIQMQVATIRKEL